MCRVKGKLDANGSQNWTTAIGRAVLTVDDTHHVVTRLDAKDKLLWQASVIGWTPLEVREVLLAKALDQIGVRP